MENIKWRGLTLEHTSDGSYDKFVSTGGVAEVVVSRHQGDSFWLANVTVRGMQWSTPGATPEEALAAIGKQMTETVKFLVGDDG